MPAGEPMVRLLAERIQPDQAALAPHRGHGSHRDHYRPAPASDWSPGPRQCARAGGWMPAERASVAAVSSAVRWASTEGADRRRKSISTVLAASVSRAATSPYGSRPAPPGVVLPPTFARPH